VFRVAPTGAGMGRVKSVTVSQRRPPPIFAYDAILAILTAVKWGVCAGYTQALKTGTNPDLTAALTIVEAANPTNSDAEVNEIAHLTQAHSSY
jgi:hypothetical protein